MKSLGDIARLVDGVVEGDPDLPIQAVRPLESAGANDISFVADYRGDRIPGPDELRAGALLVARDFDGEAYRAATSLVRVDNPRYAWARAIEILHHLPPVPFEGISPLAFVDPSAELGPGVTAGPHCCIASEARVGAGTVIYPGAYIGHQVRVGEGCVIHPNVTIYDRSVVGDRVILHASCVIGCDGFGFVPGPEGAYKVPHVGRAIIEDDCEIGGATVVDRGALDDTIIRRGCKLDNLIQIGHNCQVGPFALMAAQSGSAGSTHIGRGVQVGGQAGIAGHTRVGDGVRVGAQAGVHGDTPAGAEVLGSPAVDIRQARRVMAVMNRLPEMRSQLLDLARRLEELEGRKS